MGFLCSVAEGDIIGPNRKNFKVFEQLQQPEYTMAQTSTWPFTRTASSPTSSKLKALSWASW